MSDIELSRIDTDELHRSISNIKKVITQLETISKQEADTLSLKDTSILSKTPEALLRIIKKKAALIKKKEVYDRKVLKIQKQLLSELDKLNDREKLSIILLQRVNTFTLGTSTLQEGIQEFIEIAAKRIEQNNISVEEYFASLHASLDTTHANYPKYLETFNQKVSELHL